MVIDIGSGSLVVMRPGGGIDAFDASTGKLRWTSAKPTGHYLPRGRLLAQVATGDAELAVAGSIAENGRTLAKGTLHLPDARSPRSTTAPSIISRDG